MGDGRLLSTSDADIMYKSYGYHPPKNLQHTPQYADKNDVKYNFIPSKQRNAVFSF